MNGQQRRSGGGLRYRRFWGADDREGLNVGWFHGNTAISGKGFLPVCFRGGGGKGSQG